MYLLDIEALDLGPEVRAVGLDLMEADENREPVRGEDAARIWSRVIRATAGSEPWALDFYSHLDRVRDFCEGHGIEYREANKRLLVIPAPKPASLEGLIGRFQSETFGVRAGGALAEGADPALEGDLARRGADAYHEAYPNYYFCAICGFEDGSLVVLSEKLRAGEVIGRARPAIKDLKVDVHLPA
ncbi:MAG TPA: hypothetical protein VIY66_07980 [Candidatus Acidoferrales bacterium]